MNVFWNLYPMLILLNKNITPIYFFHFLLSKFSGVAGLYDFGPMGCALKSNILEQWKRFFVLEEQMLEIDCSMLTPERVLE